MTTGQELPIQGREPSGIHAIVCAALPNGMFRLEMPDGRETVAHAALDLRKAFTRLLAGDEVLVELSPFDPGKARILKLVTSNVSKLHPPIHPNKRELS